MSVPILVATVFGVVTDCGTSAWYFGGGCCAEAPVAPKQAKIANKLATPLASARLKDVIDISILPSVHFGNSKANGSAKSLIRLGVALSVVGVSVLNP
ncbi:hypothetical protein [Mesorhizobium sp. STM 4661]|uniref:hypothetical protein n=1 Tax=Mesorhizobium sp. STM 4661 TaxID=1297570 RepID=UPI0002BE307F|nr:hypothetical protein [Mesorhizobium sp. STM 4661]CCV14364.1 hypothetical protein MESS4_670021 [Mesorhizobium sp. STM 4661]